MKIVESFSHPGELSVHVVEAEKDDPVKTGRRFLVEDRCVVSILRGQDDALDGRSTPVGNPALRQAVLAAVNDRPVQELAKIQPLPPRVRNAGKPSKAPRQAPSHVNLAAFGF